MLAARGSQAIASAEDASRPAKPGPADAEDLRPLNDRSLRDRRITSHRCVWTLAHPVQSKSPPQCGQGD
jgi:hypothetical protein